MHELTIARSILAIVEQRAAELHCQSVKKISLEIGELTAIDEASLRFSFTVLTKGSIAEHAILEINWLKGQAVCDFCQETVMLKNYYDGCNICKKYSLTVTQGEELRVKSMEIN